MPVITIQGPPFNKKSFAAVATSKSRVSPSCTKAPKPKNKVTKPFPKHSVLNPTTSGSNGRSNHRILCPRNPNAIQEIHPSSLSHGDRQPARYPAHGSDDDSLDKSLNSKDSYCSRPDLLGRHNYDLLTPSSFFAIASLLTLYTYNTNGVARRRAAFPCFESK